ERELLHYLEWERGARDTRSRIFTGVILSLLIIFRLAASLAWVVLYLLGGLLLFPLAMTIWGLSTFGSLPGLPGIITELKRRLDVLLLSSVGDINLFLRHQDQAEMARRQVSQAVAAVSARCAEVHIIAHSLGCAVSYDTLAQPDYARQFEK